jgi:hypothetical protein
MPEKKMTQNTIMFGMLPPARELRAVNGHWCENAYVQEHMCKLKIKQKGNKKESSQDQQLQEEDRKRKTWNISQSAGS